MEDESILEYDFYKWNQSLGPLLIAIPLESLLPQRSIDRLKAQLNRLHNLEVLLIVVLYE